MIADRARVALITGASSGIGAAVARRLAQDGVTVVINYRGDSGRAERLAADIRTGGGQATIAEADVVDAAAVARMYDAIDAELGGVDVLVNNAGVMTLAPFADLDDEAFERQFQVNVRGVFNALREAARRMGKGGRIVNISSSVTRLLHPNFGVYAATKAAVEAMTVVLARELRGREITVNAIAPGATATRLFLQGKSAELVRSRAMATPLERLGEPDDIAAAVAFLAGDDGAWINGQVIHANGGMI